MNEEIKIISRPKMSWESPIEDQMREFIQEMLKNWRRQQGRFNGLFQGVARAEIKGLILAYESMLDHLNDIEEMRKEIL